MYSRLIENVIKRSTNHKYVRFNLIRVSCSYVQAIFILDMIYRDEFNEESQLGVITNGLVLYIVLYLVRDDSKLLGDSGEAPISKWSCWQFDFRCEIFSLLDGKKVGR